MNWKQRIENAERSKIFIEQDLIDSGDWHACPVGEVLNLRDDPRTFEQLHAMIKVEHHELFWLGMKFAQNVNVDKIKQEKEIYKKIQEEYKPS